MANFDEPPKTMTLDNNDDDDDIGWVMPSARSEAGFKPQNVARPLFKD